MTDLKILLVEELLNALDDIQQDIPYILDYYMESNHAPDDNIHMDLDLLSMNITGLRDSAKLIRASINTELLTSQLHQNTDSTLIRSMTPYKHAALAMFLHIHMLTDPESIYNSGIICGDNWGKSTQLI